MFHNKIRQQNNNQKLFNSISTLSRSPRLLSFSFIMYKLTYFTNTPFSYTISDKPLFEPFSISFSPFLFCPRPFAELNHDLFYQTFLLFSYNFCTPPLSALTWSIFTILSSLLFSLSFVNLYSQTRSSFLYFLILYDFQTWFSPFHFPFFSFSFPISSSSLNFILSAARVSLTTDISNLDTSITI